MMDKATWEVIQARTTWTHSTPGIQDQQEFQTLEFHIHPMVEFGTINVESTYKPVQKGTTIPTKALAPTLTPLRTVISHP